MKVCIIGGGAGGRSASGLIRQLDKEAQIDIFSKQSEVGYAPCELPFVLRGNIVTWEDIFYPGDFFNERQINLHVNTEVTDILREEKRIIAGGESYDYDKAILSMGAIPSIPPIPGVDGKNEFTLSTNIADGRALGAIIPKYSRAAVIGAGAIGLEITLALLNRGYQNIYLLDILENILPTSLDKDMTERIEGVMREKGVEVSVVHLRIDTNDIFGPLRKDLPALDKFTQTHISIPLHNSLTDEDVEYIIRCIKEGW